MKRLGYLGMVALALCAFNTALADFDASCDDPNTACFERCGQVNVSGATLFRDFFTNAGSTNDWINADCDFVTSVCDPNDVLPYRGYNECFSLFPQGYNDQLAVVWRPVAWTTWWALQYRGVGSGNGLAEFVNFQVGGVLPSSVPAEVGLLNRYLWADGGFETGACCTPDGCVERTQSACANIPGSVFLGLFTVCGDEDMSACDAAPYGACVDGDTCTWTTEAGCEAPGVWLGAGERCEDPSASGTPLPPESIDLAVMDVPTSWFVTQTGTGDWDAKPVTTGYGNNPAKSKVESGAGQSNKLKSLCYTFPGGEVGCLNLNLADPDESTVYDTAIAWVPIGVIANRGTGIQNAKVTELQYHFVTGRYPDGRNYLAATRDSGSGTRNGAMNSLGIDPSYGVGDNQGYKSEESTTDLIGPNYEVCNRGGSSRIEGSVQNGRLAMGYTGLFGESRAIPDASSGRYEIVNIMFDDRGGSSYIRPTVDNCLHNCDPDTGYNVTGPETFASVGDPEAGRPGHVGNPGMTNPAAQDYLLNIIDHIADFTGVEEDFFCPADVLASNYFLLASTDCAQDLLNPTLIVNPNPVFNPAIQTVVEMSQIWVTPVYGVTTAGKVPTRTNISPETYTDGSSAAYINWHTGSPLTSGSNLNERNRIAGDFAYGDDMVTEVDVELMVIALFDRAEYYGDARSSSDAGNPAVLEIIGDFNGDGNFDSEDARYLADSYLVKNSATGATWSRYEVFQLIDSVWEDLTGGDDNFFDTTIEDCYGNTRPWVRGATAFDVAGNTPWPGAYPHGQDGFVNCTDAQYVDAKFGDWTLGVTTALGMDLSCDMDGDLDVDCDDLAMVLEAMCTTWDCCELEHECTWTVEPALRGDLNCDGALDLKDINPFTVALANPAAYAAAFPDCCVARADINCDGEAGLTDINPFVVCLTSGTGCAACPE